MRAAAFDEDGALVALENPEPVAAGVAAGRGIHRGLRG
jgi:hypothetical protein